MLGPGTIFPPLPTKSNFNLFPLFNANGNLNGQGQKSTFLLRFTNVMILKIYLLAYSYGFQAETLRLLLLNQLVILNPY